MPLSFGKSFATDKEKFMPFIKVLSEKSGIDIAEIKEIYKGAVTHSDTK